MIELLNEREAELIYEQQEACEKLSAEVCSKDVDQSVVGNITQRIQTISGRIKEVQNMKRLEECNAKYNKEIEECELYMYECKVESNFKNSYYWQKCRDELIEEYKAEQNKLIKQIDKTA